MYFILIIISILAFVVLLNLFNKKSESSNYRDTEKVKNNSVVKKTFHTKVAGVTFKNNDGNSRQKIIQNCIVGERLLLIPEPNNKHDRDAVKVCKTNNQQIGYLKKELAYDVKILLADSKSKLNASITSINGVDILGVSLKINYHEIKVKKQLEVKEKVHAHNIKMHHNNLEKSTQAKVLQQEGYVENAIEMYESVINTEFSEPSSYRRLIIIYHSRKEYNKEIVVIEKLINMYKKKHGDHYNIVNLKNRLEVARMLQEELNTK